MIAEQIIALLLLTLCGGFGLGWAARRETDRRYRRRRRTRTRAVVRESIRSVW